MPPINDVPSEKQTLSRFWKRTSLLVGPLGVAVGLAVGAAGCAAAPDGYEDGVAIEPYDDEGDDNLADKALAPVVLPIEVLGVAGTTQSVQVQVDNPTGVTHLYVRCNACGYHDSTLDKDSTKVKATVRINGGTAINLKHYKEKTTVYGNTNIEIIGVEKDYGGTGGGFRTVRMKVPVTGLVAGVNTITFEHKTQGGASIGFRILDLNLLRNGVLTDKVLPASTFVQDNPANWTAPRTASTEIDLGRTLWSKKNSLYDPAYDALDGQMDKMGTFTGAISASCADCHAADGRDLAYFNFSNKSIIERTYFHGLTKADGERIASYIRTLPLTKVAAARPWNPTYQPGPGMDAKPVYEWSAGAGVDAILDTDAEMSPKLFPLGVSLAEVRKVVDRFNKLNMRELPISLPMPEWNQWLPLVHPDDAFNTSAVAVNSNEAGTSVGKPYYTKLYEDAKTTTTADSVGRLTSKIKPWLQRAMDCSTNGPGNGEPWRGLNGNVLNAIKLPKKTFTSSNCSGTRTTADDINYERAKYGLAAWISVKQWEIQHGKSREAQGNSQTVDVCSNTTTGQRCVKANETFGWVVNHRNVFDRPPHFQSHNSRHFYWQNMLSGLVETNSWYHLNMILNTGYRQTMPTHFAYVYSHVELLQKESGISQGYRFWAGMIKQRQLQTNGKYGIEEGLSLRTAQPYIYYGTRKGDPAPQSSVGQPLYWRLVEAMIENFVADANNGTAANWTNATGNETVQVLNSPSSAFTPIPATGDPFLLDDWQGTNTYRAIPKLREIGVESGPLSSLKAWAKKTWPNANWDAL